MQTQGLRDESTADLLRKASEQLTALVRDEMRLARTEMAEKGKRAGLGAGLYGAAAVAALYGVAASLAAVILALALIMPAWASALAVAGALFLIAAVVVLLGRSFLRRAVPPLPTETVHSVRNDLRAVTSAVGERKKP